MQLPLNLFDQPPVSVSPSQSRQASRATKRAALRGMSAASRGAQAERVLECLRSAGTTGMTRHEIADELRLPLSSVCGRVNDLLIESPSPVYQLSGCRRDGRSIVFARV